MSVAVLEKSQLSVSGGLIGIIHGGAACVEQAGGFSGQEAYNTWAWPAVGTFGLAGGATYGPYSPDPAYVPGGALYGSNFPMPQAFSNPQLIATTTFSSVHNGVVNAALMDGSVRSINVNLSQQTWNYLLVPDDGQVLGDDW